MNWTPYSVVIYVLYSMKYACCKRYRCALFPQVKNKTKQKQTKQQQTSVNHFKRGTELGDLIWWHYHNTYVWIAVDPILGKSISFNTDVYGDYSLRYPALAHDMASQLLCIAL